MHLAGCRKKTKNGYARVSISNSKKVSYINLRLIVCHVITAL